MSGQRWKEVTRENPCPACGKPDWCGWTPDGQMLKCERTAHAPADMVLVKAQDGGGLFRWAESRPAPCRRAGGEIAATYDYRDADGELLYQVVRYEPKRFRQRRPKGKGDWIWKLDGVPRVLYRLPELVAADPAAWVFVPEGEKDADNVAGLGHVATTNPGGRMKWSRLSDDSALAGRRVAILYDRDEDGGGWQHALDRARRLHGRAAEVRIVDLPDDHKDVSEWMDSLDGKSPEELAAALTGMAEAAEVWTPAADATGATPVLTCLADVQPTIVKWLWPGRIALGKLTLLVGDPGLGKSFITLDMAARVSKGAPWPDSPDADSIAGGVVLLSAEDDPADTIRPRLDAAEADVDRIFVLRAVKRVDAGTKIERQEPFSLTTDLPALERAIADMRHCRLVVIDPISAYLGRADSHVNAVVRGLLAPLGEVAAKHGVAVVAVTHLRKGEGPAMYRTMGSLGFVAAARAAHVVTKDRDDLTGQRRFMLPLKNNLATDRTGLAYRLDGSRSANGQPTVRWEADPVDKPAEEALRPDGGRSGAGDPSELDETKAWLRDALAGGPKAAREIIESAKGDGIAKRTLDRAKRALGVIASKAGFEAGWTWQLPGTPDEPPKLDDCADGDSQGEERRASRKAGLATFGNLGDLRGDSRESAGAPGIDAPDPPEERQPTEMGALPGLDPERPGPIDVLSPEQRERYMAVYYSRSTQMSPDEKHRCAWRVAAGGRDPERESA